MLLMLLLHTRPWALTKQWAVRMTHSATIYGGFAVCQHCLQTEQWSREVSLAFLGAAFCCVSQGEVGR